MVVSEVLHAFLLNLEAFRVESKSPFGFIASVLSPKRSISGEPRHPLHPFEGEIGSDQNIVGEETRGFLLQSENLLFVEEAPTVDRPCVAFQYVPMRVLYLKHLVPYLLW